MNTNELLYSFLPALLTFLSGGGLTYLISIKYTRKQAEANAMSSVQDVYQQLIKDLQDDREHLKEEKKTGEDRFQRIINELTLTVKANTQDIAELKKLRCTNASCNLRINN